LIEGESGRFEPEKMPDKYAATQGREAHDQDQAGVEQRLSQERAAPVEGGTTTGEASENGEKFSSFAAHPNGRFRLEAGYIACSDSIALQVVMRFRHGLMGQDAVRADRSFIFFDQMGPAQFLAGLWL
jgi:hypothetical protein